MDEKREDEGKVVVNELRRYEKDVVKEVLWNDA